MKFYGIDVQGYIKLRDFTDTTPVYSSSDEQKLIYVNNTVDLTDDIYIGGIQKGDWVRIITENDFDDSIYLKNNEDGTLTGSLNVTGNLQKGGANVLIASDLDAINLHVLDSTLPTPLYHLPPSGTSNDYLRGDHTWVNFDDNLFDQDLNTTNNVEFVNINFTGGLYEDGVPFSAGGVVKQVKYTLYNTRRTFHGTMNFKIPFDYTTPTNTEGQHIFSANITPQNANNYLIIDVILIVTGRCTFPNDSIYGTTICTLFRDNETYAISTSYNGNKSAGQTSDNIITMRHVILAGSTSQQFFKVRAGMPEAATNDYLYINDYFGTSSYSSITITEISV